MKVPNVGEEAGASGVVASMGGAKNLKLGGNRHRGGQ